MNFDPMLKPRLKNTLKKRYENYGMENGEFIWEREGDLFRANSHMSHGVNFQTCAVTLYSSINGSYAFKIIIGWIKCCPKICLSSSLL
jgi:hypothetical protein